MVLLTAEKNPFTRDSLQGPSSQNYKKLFKNTEKKHKKHMKHGFKLFPIISN